MAEESEAGRPLPILVVALLASFVLMVLSGVFYALGLPEDWARGLFMVTVILWFILGGALIAKSFLETSEYAKRPKPTPAPSKKEAAEDDD
jgi:Na+/melibiose symporter-like transporter